MQRSKDVSNNRFKAVSSPKFVSIAILALLGVQSAKAHAFVVGSRVMAGSGGVNVRDDALNPSPLFLQPEGVFGRIVGGPNYATVGSYTGNWWKIDWESKPVNQGSYNGWSADAPYILDATPAGDVAAPNFSTANYTTANHFWVNGDAPGTNVPSNPWPADANGNCTWYAYGRMLELGFNQSQLEAIAPAGHGSAYQWAINAAGPTASSLGVTVDTVPTVGSIAERDIDSFSSLGHVAVVESVNADGTITVTESCYSTSTTSAWNFLWHHRTTSPTWFSHFIHCTTGSSTATPTQTPNATQTKAAHETQTSVAAAIQTANAAATQTAIAGGFTSTFSATPNATQTKGAQSTQTAIAIMSQTAGAFTPTPTSTNTPAATYLGSPILLGPASGATGASTSATFSWLPVAGANRYWLMVSTSLSDLPNNPNATSCPGCVATGLSGNTDATSFTAGNAFNYSGTSRILNANTTYYWQVQAWNTNGTQGQYSVQRTFDTNPVTPGPTPTPVLLGAPSLGAPFNGATHVSTSPTFSWGGVAGANIYWLMVSPNAADFPTTYNGFSDINCPSCLTDGISVGVSATQFTNGDSYDLTYGGISRVLSPDTLYYWKVQAWNTNGTEGNYSVLRSFTTDPTGPSPTPTATPVPPTATPNATQTFAAIQTVNAAATLTAVVTQSATPNGSTPCSGTYQLQWGSWGTANGQFENPTGLAVDNLGNVYVADNTNNRVQKFDSNGNWLATWGSYGPSNGQFQGPEGVCVDGSGNIVVAGQNIPLIQKFSAAGSWLATWSCVNGTGNGQLAIPWDVTYDNPNGVFYVADTYNHRIQKFSSSGVYMAQWGSLGSGNGQFNYPVGVAVDSAGNVFVSDRLNNRIQKFTSSGAWLGSWGSYGSGNGQFWYPEKLAIRGTQLFVVDENNRRIQQFDTNGNWISKWGVSGNGNGQFGDPWGIAVDNAGNVYVSDNAYSRVQKFGCAAPPATLTVTPSSTASSTAAPTLTVSKTSTPSATVSATDTRTMTLSATRTKTMTPTVTSTTTVTPSRTPTVTQSCTFTISPTFTVSPTETQTFTASPTYSHLRADRQNVVLGPVPARRGEAVCLAFPAEPVTSTLVIYNAVGDKVAVVQFENSARQCVETGSLVPGIYFVIGETETAAGHDSIRQKIVIVSKK